MSINNKHHSSIKLSPYAASKPENTELIIQNLYGIMKQDIRKQKLNIGDRVRIYKYKTLFEKGYKPNWTKEVFIVNEVNSTNPLKYKIFHLKNEPIIGSFYTEELQTKNL